MTLNDQVEELTSVEDFFELFDVEFDTGLVQHGRVKLLTLFNRNLAQYNEPFTFDDYKAALSKAYCLLQRGVVVPLMGSACSTCTSEC